MGTIADGQVLVWSDAVDGFVPEDWPSPSGSPLTTKGDIFGYSTVDARIPVGSNGQVLTADSAETLGVKWATPSSGVTFANPSAQVGLTVVNGSATTAMRSDAAPPLNQAIAPTWTSAHLWQGASNRIARIYEVGAGGPSRFALFNGDDVEINSEAGDGYWQHNTAVTIRDNGLGNPALLIDGSPTASYALLIHGDGVRLASIPPTAPELTLGLAGTSRGKLLLTGNTSGTVTIQPAAAAGTWALTLPVNDGDAGQALITDGSGVSNWGTVLTANQTITLSGDVTGSGSTAITATIAAQNSTFWRGKVTDETGSGLWVFNDSPTLITPVLGVASGTSLNLSGNLTVGGVASHLIPSLPDTYDLGSFTNPWRSGHISEMNATLFAQNTISVVGGWLIVTKDEGTTDEDVDTSETQIDFGSNAIAANDFIVFRSSGAVEYMQATSVVAGNVWNVTRNVDGSGANAWPQGSVWVNFGYNGTGRIELNANATPRISMLTQGTAYNVQTELLRLGDLNGWGPYVAETYGFATGIYGVASKTWETIEQTNGIRLGVNATTLFKVDTSGNVTMGEVATDQGNVFWNISNKKLEFRGSTAGTVVQAYVDTTGAIKAGAGVVLLDVNGASIRAASSKTEVNSLKFYSTAGTVLKGSIYSVHSSNSAANLIIDVEPGSGSGTSDLSLISGGASASAASAFIINTNNVGSLIFTTTIGASTNAKLYTADGATLVGLIIGSNATPTAMLDVRGNISTTGNLLLPEGGVINWDAGDVTITQTGNNLAFAGASSGYTFDAPLIAGTFPTDSGAGSMIITGATGEFDFVRRGLTSWPGTPAAGDRIVWYVTSDGSWHAWTDITGDIFTLSKTGAVRFNTYGAGTLTTDASGNITATSDERLKDSTGNFSLGLETLMALPSAQTFKWKPESGMETHREYVSWFAQDVQPLIPLAVGQDPLGYLTLTERPILAMVANSVSQLVEAILNAPDLDSLKNKVRELAYT